MAVFSATPLKDSWLHFESEARKHFKRDTDNPAVMAPILRELDTIWNDFSAQSQADIEEDLHDYRLEKGALETAQAIVQGASAPDVDGKYALKNYTSVLSMHSDLARSIGTYLDAVKALRETLGAEGIESDAEFGQAYLKDMYKKNEQAGQAVSQTIADLEHTISEHKAEWISAEVGLHGSWVGGWHIGSGSNGSASIWVKRNSGGVIVDRLAIKDVALPAQEFWYHWANDPRAKGSPARRVPNEVLTMFNLRGREGSHTIVSIRNWTRPADARQRFYLEYCPHGDIWELHYLCATKSERLPEAFLWHTFECLAVSGLLQEHGELTPNPLSQWQTIIHMDYKTGNVFLGSAGHRYAGWPTPKLGDFGLSFLIPKGEQRTAHVKPTRPNQVWISGSRFNRAPEQSGKPAKPDAIGKDTESLPLTAKTNVWGVGIVMWSMLELREGDGRLKWDPHWDPVREGGENVDEESTLEDAVLNEPTFSKRTKSGYSSQLLDLISACLKYERDARPSFAQLLRRVRRHQDEGLDGGLRDAPADDPGFKAGFKAGKNIWKADEWAMGTLVPEEAPPPPGLTDLPSPPADNSSDSDSDDQPPGGPTAQGVRLEEPPPAPPKAPTPSPLSAVGAQTINPEPRTDPAPPTTQPPAAPAEVPTCKCKRACAQKLACKHPCCKAAHAGYNADAQPQTAPGPRSKAGASKAKPAKPTLKSGKSKKPSEQAAGGAEGATPPSRKRPSEDDDDDDQPAEKRPRRGRGKQRR